MWTAIRATPLISARHLRILAFASKQLTHPERGEEPPIACKSKLVFRGHMATVEPLSPSEEEMWRALMRIVKTLTRHLDSDLVRSAGLTASEYTTIMHLSEAPNRELRMADLAEAAGLSASRT